MIHFCADELNAVLHLAVPVQVWIRHALRAIRFRAKQLAS